MSEFTKIDFIRFCFEEHDTVSSLAPDKIPYMDLTYCLNGSMHYIYNGEHVYLSEGDAILFPQGSVRTRIESDIPSFYCSLNIHFRDDFTAEVSGFLPNSLRSDTSIILNSLKNSFFSVSDEKNEKCCALFWYLYYQLIETAVNNEHPHIKHIKQYVAKHLSDNITLEDIAENVHLTPQYCCSLFSKHMGQTLFEFITNQRIEYAKGMIVTSDVSLTEIAGRCGFCDYNYFSRVFRNTTGMQASKYRAINKSKYFK